MLEAIVTLLEQQTEFLTSAHSISTKLSGSANAARQVGALNCWGI